MNTHILDVLNRNSYVYLHLIITYFGINSAPQVTVLKIKIVEDKCVSIKAHVNKSKIFEKHAQESAINKL